jgi:hypothetical protein
MEQITEKPKSVKKGKWLISRYSLSGQLLETYKNTSVAAKAMNTNNSNIHVAAKNDGRAVTACGYIWRPGNEPEIDIKALLKKKWYHASPLAAKQQTVGQYDLEGNLVNTHINSLAAAKAVGVHQNGIRDVIKGRGMTYGGFIWSKTIKKKIAVDPRITEKLAGVSQYDMDGRWIRSFKSCYEAARITQIDNGQIHHALNGHMLNAGGYLWRKGQQLRININELRRHPTYKGSELQRHMKRKREMAMQ